MSILAGIGSLVDEWLQIEPKGKPPCYRHKSAALDLSRRDAPVAGTREFLEASYTQIHNNWLAAIEAGYSKPSKENWRWKRHLKLSPQNTSPELKLERSIVNAYGDSWSNQMPTASGLVGPVTEKRAAVDLVYRESPTNYSLIELKVGSDNPLFAAIEILMSGLLFVWSRNNHDRLGYDLKKQPVLAAETLTLAVLAPGDFYRDFKLTNLAFAIDNGLAEFSRRDALTLRFRFYELGMAGSPGSIHEVLCPMPK